MNQIIQKTVEDKAQEIQDYYFERGARLKSDDWNWILNKITEVYMAGGSDAVEFIREKGKSSIGDVGIYCLRNEDLEQAKQWKQQAETLAETHEIEKSLAYKHKNAIPSIPLL